jgi:hypothetical protein
MWSKDSTAPASAGEGCRATPVIGRLACEARTIEDWQVSKEMSMRIRPKETMCVSSLSW